MTSGSMSRKTSTPIRLSSTATIYYPIRRTCYQNTVPLWISRERRHDIVGWRPEAGRRLVAAVQASLWLWVWSHASWKCRPLEGIPQTREASISRWGIWWRQRILWVRQAILWRDVWWAHQTIGVHNYCGKYNTFLLELTFIDPDSMYKVGLLFNDVMVRLLLLPLLPNGNYAMKII